MSLYRRVEGLTQVFGLYKRMYVVLIKRRTSLASESRSGAVRGHPRTAHYQGAKCKGMLDQWRTVAIRNALTIVGRRLAGSAILCMTKSALHTTTRPLNQCRSECHTICRGRATVVHFSCLHTYNKLRLSLEISSSRLGFHR